MEQIIYLFGNCVSSEIRSKDMLIIMDISFISDGWSYSRNPGRFPGRSGQLFPATATSCQTRGHGAVYIKESVLG
jgi:hypothetical protein